MKLVAVLAGETIAAVVAASGLDSGSQKVVLYTAAAAGVLWGWVHVIRPLLRWARSLARSAEAFEALPEWMATVEAEVARVVAGQNRIENRQRAFNRDMGVKVRGESSVDEFDAQDGEQQGPSAPA